MRYISMSDGQFIAIPEKCILEEIVEDDVCVLRLEGGADFTYSLKNVADTSSGYDVTALKLHSFKFTHDDNDQVYADVEAAITEEGDTLFVTADVPVIGKRLRPSFTLDEGVTMWVDGVQQVSGQSSQRFTEPVIYTLAEPEHWIYSAEAGSFKPFGRPCKVSVKYLTDYAAGEYKIPTVYLTFGDGVTWDDSQWIGQTIMLEDGTTVNTKEEWIEDCTVRLDGAVI